MKEFWSLSHANKFSIFFYFGLLFLFSSQLGRHFWPEFSFVSGLKVDYLSPTLYLSDIFLLGLVISILRKVVSTLHSSPQRFILLGFMLYLILNAIFSISPLNSLYGFLRFIGYAFFAFATWYFWRYQEMVRASLIFLAIGLWIVSFLALFQFLLQHSIGGIFYFWGERSFSGQTPGIANASLNGTLVLRPYATFPHPNVLGGFLVIVMTLLLYSRDLFKESLSNKLWLASLLLGSGGLMLTMSRSAIVVWIVILVLFILGFVKKKKVSKRSIFLLSVVVLICFFLLLPRFAHLSLSSEPVAIRLALLQSSWLMFWEHPVVGVGLKNFLIYLPNFSTLSFPYFTVQPVHNIFVLAIVETGIWGVIFILWLGYVIGKKIIKAKGAIKYLKISLSIILIILGFVDHYFYTLHQGQLLLALVVGILWLDSSVLFHLDRRNKQISRKG